MLVQNSGFVPQRSSSCRTNNMIMSLNPLPKIRTGVKPEDMTWNEHFYMCLAKRMWLIAAVALFGLLILVRMNLGTLGGLGSIFLTFIIGFGCIYLVIALPVSIIYAFVMRNRYK